VTVVLAVSDEVDRVLLAGGGVRQPPDLIVSCGDLPFDYLEALVERFAVPLLFVPGNHDPAVGSHGARPTGCTSVDGRVVDVAGIRVAGLGGSIRYRPGDNQYTDDEMRERARALVRRCHDGGRPDRRPVDLFLAHAPPRDLGDEDDPPHRGFEAFGWLLDEIGPATMAHGHVHPYGLVRPDRVHGSTRIVNVIPRRVLMVEP
jgi:uncharacterized protein